MSLSLSAVLAGKKGAQPKWEERNLTRLESLASLMLAVIK
jgi:hypothetical protein